MGQIFYWIFIEPCSISPRSLKNEEYSSISVISRSLCPLYLALDAFRTRDIIASRFYLALGAFRTRDIHKAMLYFALGA